MNDNAPHNLLLVDETRSQSKVTTNINESMFAIILEIRNATHYHHVANIPLMQCMQA